jgi:hypothetical protein
MVVRGRRLMPSPTEPRPDRHLTRDRSQFTQLQFTANQARAPARMGRGDVRNRVLNLERRCLRVWLLGTARLVGQRRRPATALGLDPADDGAARYPKLVG